MSKALEERVKSLLNRVGELEKGLVKAEEEVVRNRVAMSEMISFLKPFTERISIIREAAFTSGVKIDYLLEAAYKIKDFGASDEGLAEYLESARAQVKEAQEQAKKEAEDKAKAEIEKAKEEEVLQEA